MSRYYDPENLPEDYEEVGAIVGPSVGDTGRLESQRYAKLVSPPYLEYGNQVWLHLWERQEDSDPWKLTRKYNTRYISVIQL